MYSCINKITSDSKIIIIKIFEMQIYELIESEKYFYFMLIRIFNIHNPYMIYRNSVLIIDGMDGGDLRGFLPKIIMTCGIAYVIFNPTTTKTVLIKYHIHKKKIIFMIFDLN